MWKKWLRRLHEEWVHRLLGQDEERSVIGPGLQIRGPITGVGELEIRGRVEGDIVHCGRLIIAAGALCLGSIQTDELQLAGEVHGHIHARDKLELMETGRLYGDTVCGSLQVHPGATFQGTNRMAEGLLPEPRRTASVPAPATAVLTTAVLTTAAPATAALASALASAAPVAAALAPAEPAAMAPTALAPAASALAILREPIRTEEPPPPWVQELFESAPAEKEADTWADELAAPADEPHAQAERPAAPATEPKARAYAEPALFPPEIPAFQGGFGPVPAVRNTG